MFAICHRHRCFALRNRTVLQLQIGETETNLISYSHGIGYREMSQYDRINVVSALDSAWEGLNSLLNVSRYYLLV